MTNYGIERTISINALAKTVEQIKRNKDRDESRSKFLTSLLKEMNSLVVELNIINWKAWPTQRRFLLR